MEQLHEQVSRLQARALAIGVLASVAAIAGLVIEPSQFFQSYLYAFLFWLGISAGSMAVIMVHHLSGGAWGFIIRRILEAAAMTLPLMALLFLPVLFGMHRLFIWTHGDVMAASEVLQHKSRFFLNVPWFVVRAVIYFAIWILTAVLLRRWSLAQDHTGDRAITERFQHFCGPALVLYVFTMSLAAIDWIMALEPTWYSTIFGLLVICGQGLSTFAFAIVMVVFLAGRQLLSEVASRDAFRDLGNMMLAFVLLWTYMAFSQYLIIWSGNLSHEATWYVHRGEHGWQWMALFLVGCQFFLPFVALLFGTLKKSFRALAMVALLLLAAHLVDTFWLVAPAFHPGSVHLSWLDIVLPVALGGFWLACFAWQLKGHALVPLHDPRYAGHTVPQEVMQNV